MNDWPEVPEHGVVRLSRSRMSNTDLLAPRCQSRKIAVISPMCVEAPTREIGVPMTHQNGTDVFMIQEAFGL